MPTVAPEPSSFAAFGLLAMGIGGGDTAYQTKEGAKQKLLTTIPMQPFSVRLCPIEQGTQLAVFAEGDMTKMGDMKKMQWEKIETAHLSTDMGLFGLTASINVALSRTKVPGGWLVLAETVGGAPYPVAITFYPDPAYAWEAETSR